MSFISINGDNTIPQPSTLKEEIIRQVHDRVSVTGVVRRIWLADKYLVTIGWTALNQTQYNQLAPYLFNQANTVTYYNSVTGVSIVGFPTNSTDQFLQGASFLKNFTATIQQV